MLRRAARQASSTRRSTASSGRCDEARAGVLGLGRAGRGAVAARARRARSCARRSASTARSCERPVALEDVRLREPALDPAVRRAAGGDRRRRRGPRRPRGARAALPRQVLPRPAGAARRRVRGRARRGRGARRPRRRRWRSLQACAEAGVAVVPFGGGTSVVGGLEPDCAARSRRWSRSTSGAWTGCSASTSARSPPCSSPASGCPRPTARSPRTASRSATCRRATSGRRSAAAWRRARPGQASTGHGRIDANLVAVRCATPLGELATLEVPASAAGPSLRQRRGRLGGRARRHHAAPRCACIRVPEAQRYEGWFAPGLRGRLRRAAAARAGAAPRPTSRGCPTRTRRASRSRWPAPARCARDDPRAPARRGGCLLVLAAGRASPDAVAPPPRGRRAAAARRRARRSWGRGRARVGRLALRRPAPARRPARPRRDGGDARDRDLVVEPRRAARRRARGAAGPARRLPRLAPVPDGRVAVLHRARPPRRRRSGRLSGAR